MSVELNTSIIKGQYKLRQPDGGWGYIVTISMAVMLIVTVENVASFGIIYGKYLATIGDEGSATAMINGIFFGLSSTMGLLASHLMKTYSCRYVGLIGSILLCCGSILTVFAKSVWQFIVTFSILQGMGFGIMMPTSYACFNQYFDKRKNLMMGVCQSLVACISMGMPHFSQYLMDTYGYQGTVAILAAISLHDVAAMLTLHPVEQHMVKVPIQSEEMHFLAKDNNENDAILEKCNEKEEIVLSPGNNNLFSFLKQFWYTISSFLEFSLLKDPSYANINFGLALTNTSEIEFMSMLAMFLYHMNFNNQETANLLTIYLLCDLFGRISLSVISAFFKINNKLLFFFAATVVSVFRIVFISNSGNWTVILLTMIILGFMRSSLMIIFPLVVADSAPTNYPAAIGLYFSTQGIFYFISGQIISLVALHTIGDTWIQGVLTIQLLLCVIPWTTEIVYKAMRNMKEVMNNLEI